MGWGCGVGGVWVWGGWGGKGGCVVCVVCVCVCVVCVQCLVCVCVGCVWGVCVWGARLCCMQGLFSLSGESADSSLQTAVMEMTVAIYTNTHFMLCYLPLSMSSGYVSYKTYHTVLRVSGTVMILFPNRLVSGFLFLSLFLCHSLSPHLSMNLSIHISFYIISISLGMFPFFSLFLLFL